MKKIKISYWIFTGLFAFLMLGSAIPDIFSTQVAVEGFKQMGLPSYLLPFLGIAKLLGVVAILIPGYPRIKEWAYAGLIFDLTGATWSIMASSQAVGNWIFMALPIILGIGSYVFYHKKLHASSAARNNSTVNQSGYYRNEEIKIADASVA